MELFSIKLFNRNWKIAVERMVEKSHIIPRYLIKSKEATA